MGSRGRAYLLAITGIRRGFIHLFLPLFSRDPPSKWLLSGSSVTWPKFRCPSLTWSFSPLSHLSPYQEKSTQSSDSRQIQKTPTRDRFQEKVRRSMVWSARIHYSTLTVIMAAGKWRMATCFHWRIIKATEAPNIGNTIYYSIWS
jgi:hypothetical protein